MSSLGNQIGNKVRTLASIGQPNIEFIIDDSDGPRRTIPSYSTMDTIAGHVAITTLYVSSCFVARDMDRWGQLIAFRHNMYTTTMTSLDRMKMAAKRAERALLGGSSWRRARNTPPA